MSKKSANKLPTLSRPPHFFVLSSPSGGGKTTLLRHLLNQREDLQLSVSYTTRKPRQNEISGKDYHFVSEEAFRQKVGQGFFLEWEQVHGFCYGTPKYLMEDTDHDIVFDVDTKGALSLKRLYQPTTLIFIRPPSLEVLEQRLRARGTETDEQLKRRIMNFEEQMSAAPHFDYVIINDNVEQAVHELSALIDRERARSS